MTSADAPRPAATTDDPATEALEGDLRALYAVPVPPLAPPHAADGTARSGVPSSGLLRRGRPFRLGLAMAGVAAALVVTIVGLPALGGAGTSTVSAQELVDRASKAGATGGLPAYHLVTVAQVGGAETRSETWQGAGGWRTEAAGPRGLWGIVDTGSGGWLYGSSRDGFTAVRVASSERGGRNLSPDSVAATLEGFTIPGCQAATITGEATILGRAAWRVEVRPTPETCTAEGTGPRDMKVVLGIGQLGTASLAIDKETALTLRLEMRDADGTRTYAYEVVALETGEAAAATGLSYVPPAGAVVRDAADFSAAKAHFQP